LVCKKKKTPPPPILKLTLVGLNSDENIFILG